MAAPVTDSEAEGRELARAAPPDMPAESDRVTRVEAMRMLGISTTQLHARVAAGELRSWRIGRDVIFERGEVEALSGRDGSASILREARELLRQSHAHNEAAMRLLLDGAKGFGEMTRGLVEKVLERNRQLEEEMNAKRDAMAKASADETQQAIAIMRAEAEVERERAMVRAGERIIPVVMARLQRGTPAEDAAVAQAVRALVSDGELVQRMRAGLKPEERLAFDSLTATLRPGDAARVVDSPPAESPPTAGGPQAPAGDRPGGDSAT